MDDNPWLTELFEDHRPRLRAVAYRMLGSMAEADDAVQEAWLRLHRTDTSDVENLGGWLTTVVARVCLNAMQSRKSRREEPLDTPMSDPIDSTDPERQAMLADAVGPALLVVLDTLAPAERLAFVLHDMFAVPFDEIAPIVGKSPAAARQLASRARRRVRGVEPPEPPDDVSRQREIVEAFLNASQNGEFEALLALLDPDVVMRVDPAAAMSGASEARGAKAVAETFSGRAIAARLALVDGLPAVVWSMAGALRAVFDFTVHQGKIVEVTLRMDADQLGELDVEYLR
jgi:RNA polymerase sigma factor (sigma-70 family)